MEALALGLPIVATTAGGTAELVTDGCEAVLVPPGDTTRLAGALVSVLEDPDQRERMSMRAKARADSLDAAVGVRAAEAIYREVARR
jgi:glycosyltransferase involved in cell wall biosynthesis